ncbi:AMP-binding protein, partial [archaeon]|nr:AMP-binding protein [archaeon]
MTLDEVLGMNVAEVIEHHGTTEGFRDRVFLTFRDDAGELQQVTFEDYFQRSVEYGAMFSEMKVEQNVLDGQRFHVGTFMQNTPEFLYAFGGCAFSGSTLVGINSSQVGEGLAFDIKNIGLNVLIADNVAQEPKKSPKTFLENVLDTEDLWKDSLGYESILARDRQVKNHPIDILDVGMEIENIADEVDAFEPRELNPDSPGVIIFTSGTTGAPKGIEVSWDKLVDVGVTATNILDYTEDDVGYVCMPLNHSNSLYLNVMPALLHGANLFLRRKFSSSQFASDVAEHSCTIFNSVGDPVQYVLNKEGDADHSSSSLRAVISTGTNAVNRAKFAEMFGLSFVEIYGSTEVGALTMVDANTP